MTEARLAAALRAVLGTDTQVVGLKYRFEAPAALVREARLALAEYDREHPHEPV